MTSVRGDAISGGTLPWSKFQPPLWEFEAIVPPAASALARAGALPRLALLCAPPGYGKTVLMSGLYHRHLQRGVRCAWITLDDRDRELSRLAQLISHAVDQAIDGSAPDILPLAMHEPDAAARLHQRLARQQEPLAVFIDNLHYCTDAELGALLAPMIFGSSKALRFVFSSVHEIPIDLVRAKMELNAMQLEASHLVFDRHCTAQLFAQAGLGACKEDELTRIQSCTEGWPAALRLLAVLSLQHGSLNGVLAQFSGEDVDIAEVLTRRVLTGFEPEVVTFLLEIALLREFSAPLAQEATGCRDAAQWIELLRSRNVLIFPLDRRHRWWRLHTLLRQHLLGDDTLTSIAPARRKDILRRAARWHASHGDMTDAIDLAIDADEFSLAREWLDTIATRVVADQGLLAQFVRWVELLNASGFPPSHEAQGWHVWSLCFTRQPERAWRALDAFDRRSQTDSPEPVNAALQQRLRLQRAVALAHSDDMKQCVADAEDWLAQDNGRDAHGTCIAHGCVAVAELALDSPLVARRRILLAEGAIARTESLYGRAWVETVAGCILLAQGEPLEAERRLADARADFARTLAPESGLIRTIEFVYARALLDLGRLEVARASALNGLDHAGLHGITDCVAPGLSACVALSRPDDADFVRRLEAVARSYPQRLQRLLEALRVRRMLRLNMREEARDLAQTIGLLGPTASAHQVQPTLDSGQVRLARADLLAASGRSTQALNEIAIELRLAKAAGRIRDLVEGHLLSANIHVQCDEQARAVRQLALAIPLAAPRGLRGPFLEHASSIEAILAQARNKDFGFTQADEIQLLEQLRHPGATAPGNGATALAPVEHLTSRELQLLELLGLGLDNQQIADRAGVSVPTVKWHLYNCYAKLGVKTRIAAVTRARTIGAIA